MEGEEGRGVRLSKRFSDDKGGGEVDYKNKSGTAWSHSYLNQKPWHPLSYPNQRRKWIAEQTHATRQRRADDVAREYAQEQEFYRQTALISKKEKEKVELMQAVSFMYVRPPGYNAESAKAAELAEEKRLEELSKGPQEPNDGGPSSSSMPPSSLPDDLGEEEKKKPRPKDVFGRRLPTEEEFEVLKNAPKLETGVAGRAKPFGVEVRNVKCLRCGTFGHQSGDRECPLKDAIMPNEESRLKRDDPLNAIIAHTDPTEPLKWELKQKPGISPPRGGFKPDDPNQQIVAEEEEIFDEYGGFLGMDNIPDLLTNFSKKPKKSKKRKHKKQRLNSGSEASSDDGEKSSKKKKVKVNKKKHDCAKSSSSNTSDEKDRGKSRHKSSYSSEDSDSGRVDRSRKTKHQRSIFPEGSDRPRRRSKHDIQIDSYSSEDSDSDRDEQSRKNIQKRKTKHSRQGRSYSPEDLKNSKKHSSYSSEDSDNDRDDRSRKNIQKHKRKHSRKRHSYSSDDSGRVDHRGNHNSRDEHYYSSDDSNSQRQHKVKRSSHKQLSTAHCDSPQHNKNYDHDRYRGSRKGGSKHSYSSEYSDVDKDDQSRKVKQEHRYVPEGSEHPGRDMNEESKKKHRYSSKDSHADRYHRSEKRRYEHSYSSESDNSDHHQRHSRRHSHKL